jgi:hypothetical protein
MSGRGPKSQKRIAKMRRRTRRRHHAAQNPELTHAIQTMAAQLQRNFENHMSMVSKPKKTRRRANANIIAAGEAILAAEAMAMNNGQKSKRLIKPSLRYEPTFTLATRRKGIGASKVKGAMHGIATAIAGKGKRKGVTNKYKKLINTAKPTFVLAPATLPSFAPYVQTNPQGLWASAQGPSLFGAIPRQTMPMPIPMNVVPVAAVPAAYAYNSEGQMSEDEDLLRGMKGL